jgi:hypothetical protein
MEMMEATTNLTLIVCTLCIAVVPFLESFWGLSRRNRDQILQLLTARTLCIAVVPFLESSR